MKTVNLNREDIISHCVIESDFDKQIVWLAEMYSEPERFETWLEADDIFYEIKRKMIQILNKYYDE